MQAFCIVFPHIRVLLLSFKYSDSIVKGLSCGCEKLKERCRHCPRDTSDEDTDDTDDLDFLDFDLDLDRESPRCNSSIS